MTKQQPKTIYWFISWCWKRVFPMIVNDKWVIAESDAPSIMQLSTHITMAFLFTKHFGDSFRPHVKDHHINPHSNYSLSSIFCLWLTFFSPQIMFLIIMVNNNVSLFTKPPKKLSRQKQRFGSPSVKINDVIDMPYQPSYSLT